MEALDQDDFYERLAQRGYGYSGLFRSLRGIGTDPARPDVVYAEVALPAGTDVTGYGIHPALLDAALHPLASVLDRTGEADSASLRIPYVFSGITLYATAATQLHVHLTRTGEDTFELRATDPTGAPVITISALTLRAVSDQIGRPASMTGLSDSLFELAWPPAHRAAAARRVRRHDLHRPGRLGPVPGPGHLAAAARRRRSVAASAHPDQPRFSPAAGMAGPARHRQRPPDDRHPQRRQCQCL